MNSFFIFLFLILQPFFTTLSAKIYDCFPFFNELELLHVRFDELYDVVDYFVIVEGKTSFTGKDKPLYFAENAPQFEKYKDKIIHLVIEDFPRMVGEWETDHWKREAYSRNYIMKALKNCNDEDIIFISDADEIPNRSAIKQVKFRLASVGKSAERKHKKKTKDDEYICNLKMKLYMYFLNTENKVGWENGCKALPYKILKKHTPWKIKGWHGKNNKLPRIPNAGWHFNTMGGMDRALYKWLLTGPQYDNEPFLHELGANPALLAKCFLSQVDFNTVPVRIDESYPRYILEHLDYFIEIGWVINETQLLEQIQKIKD